MSKKWRVVIGSWLAILAIGLAARCAPSADASEQSRFTLMSREGLGEVSLWVLCDTTTGYEYALAIRTASYKGGTGMTPLGTRCGVRGD